MSPLYPLLGLLSRGSAHGYALKQIVDSEFDPYWKIDYAQLYRSLAKLRAQGLVRKHAGLSRSGPSRQVYTITTRGTHTLAEWLAQPAESQVEFWVKSHLAKLALDLSRLPLHIVGSDDALVSQLARAIGASVQTTGSTRGLERLAEQQSDIAGSHLRAPDSNEYNVSYVKHLIPEQDIVLVNLALRDFGLMVATDNPKNIRGVRDLAKRDVRLMNRSYGAGARVWFHQQLRAARIDPTELNGWTRIAPTYETLARAIENNTADAGPGTRAAASAHGLGFVPLGQERFDLILSRELYESPRGRVLREALHSKQFRDIARSLPGYELAHSGRVVAEIKYGSRGNS